MRGMLVVYPSHCIPKGGSTGSVTGIQQIDVDSLKWEEY